MSKYEILVQVLNRLRSEAPTNYKSYHPESGDIDGINAARSKAFIHLFLKVRFGLLMFDEREAYVTEGTNDGGIDAYYIDTQTRTIFFMQSKFRQTERNFEAKAIELEELLRMDIDRILDGENLDLNGHAYNSKIKALAAKTKLIEYRDQTPYWRKRLEGRKYDAIQFRNGYATNAPVLRVLL